MPPLASSPSPFQWMAAVEAVVGTMPHWDEVGRHPIMYMGDPLGDLSSCDCGPDGAGQCLITMGDVFPVGDAFPAQVQIASQMSRGAHVDWAVPITLEFARCRPTGATKPSSAVVREHSEKLHRDGDAIWNALICALPWWRKNEGLGPVVVTSWGPIRRDLGPCGGFTYNIVGKMRTCPECPTPVI